MINEDLRSTLINNQDHIIALKVQLQNKEVQIEQSKSAIMNLEKQLEINNKELILYKSWKEIDQ